jgi:hypothetical protein
MLDSEATKFVVEQTFGVMMAEVSKKLVNTFLDKKTQNITEQTFTDRWYFKWQVIGPSNDGKSTFYDDAVMEAKKDFSFVGNGNNPYYGSYSYDGFESDAVITFTYRPTIKKIICPGVVMLIKSQDKGYVTGIWWQHDVQYGIIGGNVEARKVRNVDWI